MDLRALPLFTFFLLLMIFILPAQCFSDNSVALSSDVLECYENEPVFGDSVYIIQSGMQHDTTVILIHGVGSIASSIWDGVIPNLTDLFHVIAVDLPGFGISTKQNTLYSPDRYAEFINWLIQKYAKSNVILVGHSMGGGFALCFAGKYPDTLSHLVLIDVCGVLHRAVLTKYVAQFKPTWGPRILQKPLRIVNDIWQSLLDGFERPTLDNDLENILNDPSLRENILSSDPNRIAGLALALHDFSGVPETISIPTTIIWGAEDDITPLRTAKILNSKISTSRLYVLDDAVHSPQLEKPDEFNQLLRRELQNPSVIQKASTDQGTKENGTNAENRTFSGLSGETLTGVFDTLNVAGCQHITIENFRANHIRTTSSRVTFKNGLINGKNLGVYLLRSEATFEQCTINSGNTGLQCRASEIEMTLTKIKADTAIATTSSRFDLAAVTIEGGWVAVWADVKTWDTPKNVSDLLFSVSRVGSPMNDRYIHGFFNVSPDSSL